MISKFAICLALTLGITSSPAAIIGTNIEAQPLTAGRIALLSAAQELPWKDYLSRSMLQLQADRSAFLNELKEQNITNSTLAPAGSSLAYLALENPDQWYREPEARRLADIVVSYQTPAGGWGKNMDFSIAPRVPGQRFTSEGGSTFSGTFDNNAATTQLRFLARVGSALKGEEGASYRISFLRGLDYIFSAQFPNGGWPQVWPLQGGYHDAITYNDGAMLHVLALLHDAGTGENEFDFLPAETRKKSNASFKRGIDCLLATQIISNGRRTVWCQQHDALTLQPCAARNYEMPSQTANESADIVLFLMQLPRPDSNIVTAVDAAVLWFKKTKIADKEFKSTGSDGRHLVDSPDSGFLWARYYDIRTDKPIFGDRDLTIHDNVDEISQERRDGYAWFTDKGRRVMQHYERWIKTPAK